MVLSQVRKLRDVGDLEAVEAALYAGLTQLDAAGGAWEDHLEAVRQAQVLARRATGEWAPTLRCLLYMEEASHLGGFKNPSRRRKALQMLEAGLPESPGRQHSALQARRLNHLGVLLLKLDGCPTRYLSDTVADDAGAGAGAGSASGDSSAANAIKEERQHARARLALFHHEAAFRQLCDGQDVYDWFESSPRPPLRPYDYETVRLCANALRRSGTRHGLEWAAKLAKEAVCGAPESNVKRCMAYGTLGLAHRDICRQTPPSAPDTPVDGTDDLKTSYTLSRKADVPRRLKAWAASNYSKCLGSSTQAADLMQTATMLYEGLRLNSMRDYCDVKEALILCALADPSRDAAPP